MFTLYTLALLLSFYLMAKIVDEYFVDSLDKIATRLDMSSDAAGATLMAMGSSAPELFIALIAVLRSGQHEAIGMGTIVGSAIFNILVITGAVGLVKKSKIPWQGAVRDLLFYTLTIIVLILVFFNGEISLWEALAMLLFYVIYVLIVLFWKKLFPKIANEAIDIQEETENKEKVVDKWWERPMLIFNKGLTYLFPKKEKYIWVFLISIALIALLSWVLVESAIEISFAMHIPEAIIALTVLAIGTSIPDLFSSIIVTRQGRGGMAVSNGVGSNIFDILVGLGLPFVLMILIDGHGVSSSTNDLMQSIILLFGSVILMLLIFIFNKWRIGKGVGLFFISLYLLYVLWQFALLYGWMPVLK